MLNNSSVLHCLQDFGSDLSLNTYMQLPVEQYYELDPAMIWPLGGKRFALKVPRVNVSHLCQELCLPSFLHLLLSAFWRVLQT